MPRLAIHLSTGKKVRLEEPKGTPIKSQHAVVVLEPPKIQRLFSKEGGTREGVLDFNFGGQTTTFGWKKRKNAANIERIERFQNQLLYLGEHGRGVDLQASVVETDEKLVRDLAKSAQGTAFGGSLAVVLGATPIVGGLLTLASKLLSYFGKRKDNDLELQLVTTLGTFDMSGAAELLQGGSYRVIRGTNPNPDIELPFRAYPFQVLQDRDAKPHVGIRIAKIEGSFGTERAKQTLFLEMNFGQGKLTTATRISGQIQNEEVELDEVQCIVGRVVYRGPWLAGVPFTMAAGTTSDKDEIKALEGVINDFRDAGKTVEGSNKDTLDNVAKAVQSLRLLILELLPKDRTLGASHGLVAEKKCFDAALLKQLSKNTGTIFPVEILNAVSGDKSAGYFEVSLGEEGGDILVVGLEVFKIPTPSP